MILTTTISFELSDAPQLGYDLVWVASLIQQNLSHCFHICQVRLTRQAKSSKAISPHLLELFAMKTLAAISLIASAGLIMIDTDVHASVVAQLVAICLLLASSN